MLETIWLIATFVTCFLLGSIPWGVAISRIFYKKDIRKEGSGNIGTTNAMRTMGKIGGAAVFVLDFGKGLLSGYFGFSVMHTLERMNYAQPEIAMGLCFLGCVWGHIFCPWLGFKGGKGIAVAVGCLFFVFGPIGALLELALFIVVVVAKRYVSLGSIAAALACPFFAIYFYWGHWIAYVLITLAALTVVWAHRGNISRLLDGTERRIGDKKAKKESDEGAARRRSRKSRTEG